MPGLVVEGDVVVERRVNAPGPEAVGQREDKEHPELAAEREPEQPQRRHQRADGGHLAGAEPADDPFAHEAGNDCAGGNGH